MKANLFACALVSVLAAAMPFSAAATETVKVKSLTGDVIEATVRKPDGPGPFPAVVLMHSSTGPRDPNGVQEFWDDYLHDLGYVTVRPDSYTSRGYDHVYDVTMADRLKAGITHGNRTKDALGTLKYLRTLPYVDGHHVGIIGWSHGASTIDGVVAGQDQLVGKGNGFAAAIGFYPDCSGAAYSKFVSKRHRLDGPGTPYVYESEGKYVPTTDLLILIGGSDDWTPAGFCEAMAKTTVDTEHPIQIKVYPGAYHSFDSYHPYRYTKTLVNINADGGRGATTSGDRASFKDSQGMVKDFFAARLAK